MQEYGSRQAWNNHVNRVILSGDMKNNARNIFDIIDFFTYQYKQYYFERLLILAMFAPSLKIQTRSWWGA